MELRDFRAEDLTLLDPPVLEPEDLEWFQPSGPAWTGVENGVIMGCWGCVDGRVWVLLSKAIRSRPFLLHRAVKRCLEAGEHAYPALEANVQVGFASARRWIERLGFESTGEIRNHAGFPYEKYVKHVRR